MNDNIYDDDDKQIRFVLTLMPGIDKAGQWAAQYFRRRTTNNGAVIAWQTVAFNAFEIEIKAYWAEPDGENLYKYQLENIKQGNRLVVDFNVEFKNLAHHTNITDDRQLIKIYRKAINPKIARRLDT